MSPRGTICPVILLTVLLWPVSPCAAQIENPVYVDDSPQAWLLFQQARDQTKDNMGEAVRLYQELLVKHGLKLIPVSRNTQDHFASVRSRVLAELLTNKDLLERYRLIESAEAQRLFQEGQLSLLAQTRTWTEPGLDALLLLGQSYLEASQFYSALHRLTEALRHPDLNSESEIGCWHMIGIASHFLGDADTVAKARQRLSAIEGGSQPRLAHLRQMIASGKGPVSIRGISTLDRTVAESLQSLIAEDIWSIDLADSLLNRRYRKDPNDPSLGRDAREQRKRRGIMNTASPTIAGERVYINEGHTIRAFDRFTGQPAWDQPYSDVETTDREDTNKDQTYDMNIVTIKNDRLVTLTGHLMVRGRSGKGKVVCLDATSGEPLWIRDISHIDESDEFERMFPYGAPIIEDGMVFFLARKVRKQQLTACYVIALDLETGNTRWIRHINTSGGRRGTARPFSTLVSDRGSLYLASPLGAIARIERHDGEIRWLRRYSVPIDNSPNNLHMPWEFDQPILLNNTLIAILPNRRRVVVLDLATGDDLESYPCTSRDGWSAPKYLLGNEHTIYAVGRNVVAFHRDDLSVPVWRLTPPTTESIDGNSFLEQRPEIRGRIQLTQDSLIVPSLYGILVVDDVTGRIRHILKAPSIGNPVAVESQLLLASGDRLDAFMSFSRAEEMLRERIASSPLDPNPGLALLRLAIRVRDFNLSIESASIVIGVMNRLGFDASLSKTNSELFARLLEVNTTGIPRTNQEGEQLFGLISSVADSTSRRIEYLLSYGNWLSKHSPQHAIEQGFQAILSDPTLASSWRSHQGQIRTASDWALDEQQNIIRKYGPDVYAPQSEFARLRLDQVSQSSPPDIEALSDLISEFPLSSAAAAASIYAAEAHHALGDTRSAMGSLTTAYFADPGRDEAGALLGAYAVLCELEGWTGEKISLLHNLKSLRPDLQIEIGETARTPQQWLEGSESDLSSTRLPTIGTPTPDAIFLDGNLVPFAPDAQRSGSGDSVLLRDDDEFKLFRASDLSPNDPTPVWTTIIEDEPARILRFTDQDLLLWFGTGGNTDHPHAIMLDPQSGERRWISPKIHESPDDPSENLRQPRVPKEQMPNDQTFDPRRTIPLINSKTMIEVQSMGSVMAIDLDDGENVLWRKRIAINQVHLAQLTDSELVIAGQIHRHDALGATLLKSMQIMILDPRSGELLHQFSPLGNTGAKWMTTGILGTLIYGTAQGIELFDLLNGRRRWANNSGGARDSQNRWLISDRLVIHDRDGHLRTIMLQDGMLSPPFNSTIDKNESPLDLREVLAGDDGIVVRYRNRIVRLDLNGNLLGADAITVMRDYQWLLTAKDRYLLINAQSRQVPVDGRAKRRIEYVYDLYLLSQNGQIIDEPYRLPILLKRMTNAMLLDNWLLISTRDQTFAIHIPANN